MHGLGLLHRWLTKACPAIHRARLNALMKAVGGVLAGGRLCLSHLGRSLPGSAYPKHAIKCIDRLLGNRHLHGERWGYTTGLYPQATPAARHLGRGWLSHKRPYGCQFHLVRQYRRGPGRPRKRHGGGGCAKRCRKLHKDPWLLITSLAPAHFPSREIVRLYGLRMKIEQGFRASHAPRWGLALQYARTQRAARLEALLLIGAPATEVHYLAGLAAQGRQWHRHFQANTTRTRAVLSVPFLGKALLHSVRFRLKPFEWISAARRLNQLVTLEAAAA